MSVKIIKREALFINRKDLAPSQYKKLVEDYTFRFYEDKACDGNGKTDPCEFRPERHTDVCNSCAAFKGGANLAVPIVLNEKKYLKLPIGGLPKIEAYLKDTEVVEKHKHNPIKPFKFLGTLKEYQGPAIKALIKYKRGILRSKPRTGKTVMFVALSAKLGLKTLIIASQREWLLGFQETYIGSKTQGALTDLNPKRIGFCKSLEDFQKYDICLATVQSLYSVKGKAILPKIKSMFGLVGIDEVHGSAADQYSKVIGQLNTEHFIGLSGTPFRKDTKEKITYNILGPVVHTVQTESLRPHVRLVRTEYNKPAGSRRWDQIVGSLETDPKRLKLIAKWAIKDMNDGHLVLILFTRISAVEKLIIEINKQAGDKVAWPFYGGMSKPDKDKTIELARRYKRKILVGNTKMLSTGVNIPRASALYEVTISSNIFNAEQTVSRILTPYEDKPDPLLRIFLDDMAVRKNCLSNEWYRCIRPKFKPIITEKDDIAFKSYLSSKGTNTKMEF